MSLTSPAAVLAPSTPLEATLRRVAGHSDRWRATIGTPSGDGWLTTAGIRGRLDALIGQVADAYGPDDPAMAGTFFLNGYARTAIGAALVSFATERRVPDIAPGNVAFRFAPNGIAQEIALAAPRFAALPGDPAARHPDVTVLPDVAALRRWLRERFVDGHIADLVEPLRRRTKRGPHALWATASDMCSGVLAILASSAGGRERLDAESQAFLATGAPLVEAPSLVPGWCRVTCCLAYRIPGHGLCASCPCLKGRAVL